MKVTLYKSAWSKRSMDNRLYEEGHGFCIQGFIAGALGFKREQMVGKTHLSQMYDSVPSDLKWIFEPAEFGKISFTSHQCFLMFINDGNRSDNDKIKLFKQILKEQGIDLEVV